MSNFSNVYSEFIQHLIELFPENTNLQKYKNEPIEVIMNRVKKFNDSLTCETHVNYLIKNKIKLFSHKESDTLAISESLFGSELTLKKIFNNQEETIKLVLWKDLTNLLSEYNKSLLEDDANNKSAQNRVNKFKILDVNKFLKTDSLNQSTNEMINDIFGSFENVLKNNNGNPFNNIVQISNLITEKYKDKIASGEINVDELLKNLTNIPGMENMGSLISSITKAAEPVGPKETIIIDENFSTAVVEQGKEVEEQQTNLNIGSLLKTVNSLGGLSGENSDMNKLMSVFGKLTSTENPEELSNIFQNELGVDVNKLTQEMAKKLEENEFDLD
jgi:hypothetical protein